MNPANSLKVALMVQRGLGAYKAAGIEGREFIEITLDRLSELSSFPVIKHHIIKTN